MWDVGWVMTVAAIAGAAWAAPPRQAPDGPDAGLKLTMELVEQTYCAVGDGTFVASFAMRATYTNHGTADMVVALGTTSPADVTVAYAGENPGPSQAPGRDPVQIDEVTTVRPGGSVATAVNGRFHLPVALFDDGSRETLMPGAYRARFYVDVMARRVGPPQPGQHGAAFPWLRLSTDPIPLTITAPGQVQECGDAPMT